MDDNYLHLGEQPDFGERHVKSKDDLVVGQKYISVLRTGDTIEFTVTKAPYKDEQLGWVVETNATDEILAPKHLEDCGLMPYSDGWNPTNHILTLPKD